MDNSTVTTQTAAEKDVAGGGESCFLVSKTMGPAHPHCQVTAPPSGHPVEWWGATQVTLPRATKPSL